MAVHLNVIGLHAETHACDHVNYFAKLDRLSPKTKDYHSIHKTDSPIHYVSDYNYYHPSYLNREHQPYFILLQILSSA